MAAILRAVGYTGLPGAGRKLKVTEVFRGWHADEPTLADGSLCAFVDQPDDDPELLRLPTSISLGHNHAVIEVIVSSRQAVFVSCPPTAAAPTAAQPPPPTTPQYPAADHTASPATANRSPRTSLGSDGTGGSTNRTNCGANGVSGSGNGTRGGPADG